MSAPVLDSVSLLQQDFEAISKLKSEIIDHSSGEIKPFSVIIDFYKGLEYLSVSIMNMMLDEEYVQYLEAVSFYQQEWRKNKLQQLLNKIDIVALEKFVESSGLTQQSEIDQSDLSEVLKKQQGINIKNVSEEEAKLLLKESQELKAQNDKKRQQNFQAINDEVFKVAQKRFEIQQQNQGIQRRKNIQNLF